MQSGHRQNPAQKILQKEKQGNKNW